MLKRILKSWKFWVALTIIVLSAAYFVVKPILHSLTDRAHDAYHERLAESIEPIAGKDCLVIIPADADLGSEEFASWTNQYLDDLLGEVTGEERPPQGSEVLTLPTSGQPECLVVLYEDPTSGENFLIYETVDKSVKVPFTPPTSNQ